MRTSRFCFILFIYQDCYYYAACYLSLTVPTALVIAVCGAVCAWLGGLRRHCGQRLSQAPAPLQEVTI